LVDRQTYRDFLVYRGPVFREQVTGISPDQLEPRKAVPYPLDHPRCAIAVLNAC
jgi:hypothetical protein